MILYAVVVQRLYQGAGIRVEDMFLAGILPGLLMVALLVGWRYWSNRHNRTPMDQFSWRAVGAAVWGMLRELPIPVVVLGGIYGGWPAIFEAAVATAAYVFFVEVVILREVSGARLIAATRESMTLVGAVLVILGNSLATTSVMLDAGVTEHLISWLQAHVDSRWSFPLVLGALFDIFSALVIVVPLIVPPGVAYGVDPVHLGIIFLANMQIGYLTPPVGMNLFIATQRFDRHVLEVYSASLPFMLILFAAVSLIT